MSFLLDTNICIYALKQNGIVLDHLLAQRPVDVALSVITEAELRTGASKSASPAKTTHLLENFLRPISVLEFTSDDARVYAQICARLERAGTPIGPLDTLIAAQAVSRSLTLVSNNEREFKRSRGCAARTGPRGKALRSGPPRYQAGATSQMGVNRSIQASPSAQRTVRRRLSSA